jgi:uncharacterized protein (TIGR02996 family)
MSKKSQVVPIATPPAPFNHPMYQSFLKDILQHPKDDTPRLILCDWLEENGYEKEAGFTRYQLSQPNGACCCHGDAEVGICCPGRDGDVWCPNCDWLRECGVPTALLGEGTPGHPRYDTRRGFLHTVRCRLADWLKYGPEAVKKCPVQKVYTEKVPYASEFSEAHKGEVRWLLTIRPSSEDIPDYGIPGEVWCRQKLKKASAQEQRKMFKAESHESLYAYYHTAEAAIEALSEELIKCVGGVV